MAADDRAIESLSNQPTQPVEFRHPVVSDAKRVWALVQATPVLDNNSPYAYLILCTHFAETSLVAFRDEQLVGFVTGLRPPHRADTLFVWQVGVAEQARRQGLGLRMLRHLVDGGSDPPFRFVEANVTPSNHASRQLFTRLAHDLGVPLVESDGFLEEDFPPSQGHEAERRLILGPKVP